VVIASLQNPDTRGQFGNVLPLEYDREQVDGPFGVDLSPQNCESRASAVSEANRRDTVVEKRVMCGAGSLSIQRVEWSSRRNQRVWAPGEILRSRGWRQDIDGEHVSAATSGPGYRGRGNRRVHDRGFGRPGGCLLCADASLAGTGFLRPPAGPLDPAPAGLGFGIYAGWQPFLKPECPVAAADLNRLFCTPLLWFRHRLRYHNQRFLQAAGSPGHKSDVDAQ
jgi:hypothetical protein